jgi:general nucleoside transport system permease protein
MRVSLVPLPRVPGWKIALAPVAAIALTLVLAFVVLALAGYDGPTVARQMFLDPVMQSRRWPDLLVKAGPLIMIAIGLSLGFRAGVWNIGAEGQYIMGAMAGTGIALATDGMSGVWILPAMLLAGVAGGAAWAAVPALLKTRAGVSEILSSLMLTYVAVQALYYMVRGPWKDPAGFNFPQTIMFGPSQSLPPVVPGSLVHWGIPLAFLMAGLVWFLMGRTLFGFDIRATGASPQAMAGSRPSARCG